MFPMKSHNLLTIYSQCCLDYRSCRHHSNISLSQSHSLQVLELEFILLRMLLPNAHSHEVLCSRECVTSLCSCLRRKPSMKIVGHVLDILSIILEEDRRWAQGYFDHITIFEALNFWMQPYCTHGFFCKFSDIVLWCDQNCICDSPGKKSNTYSSCILNASPTLARYSAEFTLRAGLIYMCYVNASISDMSIKRIWATSLTEAHHCSVSAQWCAQNARWNSIRFLSRTATCDRVLNF